MILVIDNYDSFTYNLVQRLGEIDASLDIRVFRNDQIDIESIKKLSPAKIIISPGPCTPKEAGISNEVLKTFASQLPILGVCLGHQCIGHVFGGEVIRNSRIIDATRYHSLVIKKETFTNPDFEVSAWTAEGEIMGVRHKSWELHGVQFHPESFLSIEGPKLLKNFLNINAAN